MARHPRIVVPGVAVHIVQRGNDHQACFREDTDYLVYLSNLLEVSRRHDCAIHAYCLMSNHVHLLLTPSEQQSCAMLMRDLGRRYVHYFNDRHDRTGTLWEGRFRSCLVDSREYVLACHRYIELNPVRAAMVRHPAGYRWSSYRGNSGEIVDRMLSSHVEYLSLGRDAGERRRAYLMLFADEAPTLHSAIREATSGGYPLVGEGLKAELSANGFRTKPRTPGRRRNCDPGSELEL